MKETFTVEVTLELNERARGMVSSLPGVCACIQCEEFQRLKRFRIKGIEGHAKERSLD